MRPTARHHGRQCDPWPLRSHAVMIVSIQAAGRYVPLSILQHGTRATDWSPVYVDLDGPWGRTDWSWRRYRAETLVQVLKKLEELSRLTWAEVLFNDRLGTHEIDVTELCRRCRTLLQTRARRRRVAHVRPDYRSAARVWHSHPERLLRALVGPRASRLSSGKTGHLGG